MAETVKRRLVVIPGAQKSGTSSLFNALVGHNDIGGPVVKETQFFALNRTTIEEHLEWYLAGFGPDDRVLLDASTFYLHSERAPQNVASLCSDPVVVVLVRDPAQRAYSSFLHMRKKVPPQDRRRFRTILDELIRSCESSDLREAEDVALKVAARKGDIQGDYLSPDYLRERVGAPFASVFEDRLLPYRYFTQSLYFQAIRRWSKAVGQKRVKVVAFEELIRDPAGVIGEILSFIGVDQEAGALSLPHSNPTRLLRGRVAEFMVSAKQFIWDERAARVARSIPVVGEMYRRLGEGYSRLSDLLYVQPPELDEQSYTQCFTLLSDEYDRWSSTDSVPSGWGQFG